MIDIQLIRDNSAEVIRRYEVRNFDATGPVNRIKELDATRRQTQKQLDDTLAEGNAIAREIGQLFKTGRSSEAAALKEQSLLLKQRAKDLQEQLDMAAKELSETMTGLPMLPHHSVPPGTTEADNEIVHTEGDLPGLFNNAVPHWELAGKYDIIDFEAGTKVTGSGFPIYKGKGARLQRALISFFLDEAAQAGYTEYQPPLLVNADSAFGTGQLPDKDGQMYHVPSDNLYLIPTSEVPVTNIFRDMILNEKDLPVKCTAHSVCFRREAGSYGKDVRGLNRLHQFDKVEIVQVTHPEKSYQALDEMVNYVTTLLQKLELPFRVARLCGGDLGFAAALTYDMEVYSAAQKRWLEVSSISNFETYQAQRMKLRFRSQDGKNLLAHTLNGSALALPRIMAALLENNQSEEGISIPAALQKYTGFAIIS
ncbi:MAG: serine--tRNA ligase [Bacteroidia bacterium]|nr:MAG: serine--tRNA ligase [Bacteroidia bacterium]